MTPGERVRAAAISSRPTWAMNFTAGSAAAAGEGAIVSHARHANATTAGTRCHLEPARGRVPKSVDMFCLTPLLPVFSNAWEPPARCVRTRLSNFDHE